MLSTPLLPAAWVPQTITEFLCWAPGAVRHHLMMPAPLLTLYKRCSPSVEVLEAAETLLHHPSELSSCFCLQITYYSVLSKGV